MKNEEKNYVKGENRVSNRGSRKFSRKHWILIICLVVFLISSVIRVNPYSPVGAIRYECFMKGHLLSALFLHAEKIDYDMGEKGVLVYRIDFCIPYEEATETSLDQWNVKKDKDGKYSAAFGVG